MNINNTLYTAIITPMLDNGDVDYTSLEKLLKFQANAKCGILILGSTGESLAISFQDQCKVVEFTCSLGLDTPIMVGVGGYQLDQQLIWIDFCNTQKLDSYLLVTPLYSKPGTQGQIHWFKTLFDAAQKPCILYNVPSRTGVNLSYDALREIKDHENMWAMKEASGDPKRFHEYAIIAPNLKMYSGEDAMLPELVTCGAVGLISVVSNIWPHQTKMYVEETLAKTLQISGYELWKQATAACFEASNPIPVKVWLAHKGVINTDTLKAPLLASELSGIHNLKSINDLIKAHYSI